MRKIGEVERLSEEYIERRIGRQEVKRKQNQPENEENIWKQESSPFLLLQQTAVQSFILFLSRTVDRISQTCSVVKKSTPQATTI